jgi:hypothetical protein
MPSRDEVVRISVLETAIRSALRSFPCSSSEDSRRLVYFACQCVLNTPTDEEESPRERDGFWDAFQLAERWSKGEAISSEELREAWRTASRGAETLTSKMTGAAAAHWSILCAIEAAMIAATGDLSVEAQRTLAGTAEAAARYARQACGTHSLKTAQHQKALLDEMLRTGKAG